MDRLFVAAQVVSLVFILVSSTSCSSSADPDVSADSTMGDFTEWDGLIRPDSPNNWLLAPSVQGMPTPDEPALSFPVSANILASEWKAVIEEQPRAEIIATSDDGLKIQAKQKSALFGFVDQINSEVIPLESSRSTIVVYSRSTVGYYDFGVNRARVREWVAALRERVAARD